MLTTLGLLILTAMTLASQDASEALESSYDPAETRSLPDTSLAGSWMAAEPGTRTSAPVSLQRVATRGPDTGSQSSCGAGFFAAGQTSGDPCVDCQIDCFEEFIACRQACGPIWDIWEYLGYFDNCVTEEIACENSCPCP